MKHSKVDFLPTISFLSVVERSVKELFVRRMELPIVLGAHDMEVVLPPKGLKISHAVDFCHSCSLEVNESGLSFLRWFVKKLLGFVNR